MNKNSSSKAFARLEREWRLIDPERTTDYGREFAPFDLLPTRRLRIGRVDGIICRIEEI